MNRRQWMKLSGAAVAARTGSAQAPRSAGSNSAATGQDTPDKFLLKDYRPRSIFKTPVTEIKKAKYAAIDSHCHGARPVEQLGEMVKLMDAVGVEKAVIFPGTASAEKFNEVHKIYAKYAGRFDLWCGLDLSGSDRPGFGPNAIKALEDCHRAGAVGVGEIIDKGRGLGARGSAAGPHPDDPRMDPLFARCAQLGMPVSLHVSDPIWAYEPMDLRNDGLMNAYTWRIDDKQPGVLEHNGLIDSLERTLEKHRKTVFVACHLDNLDYDLTRLGQMFDRHPNLYADISARFGETAPIPRSVNRFLQKHPDRVLYGTDMTYTQRMFSVTFRILESSDEHFYETDLFNYHWPLYGFGLPDALLRRIYRENALKAFKQARASTS
jgi:predicted TIM-barrel fold metal-dependent hydrolase